MAKLEVPKEGFMDKVGNWFARKLMEIAPEARAFIPSASQESEEDAERGCAYPEWSTIPPLPSTRRENDPTASQTVTCHCNCNFRIRKKKRPRSSDAVVVGDDVPTEIAWKGNYTVLKDGMMKMDHYGGKTASQMRERCGLLSLAVRLPGSWHNIKAARLEVSVQVTVNKRKSVMRFPIRVEGKHMWIGDGSSGACTKATVGRTETLFDVSEYVRASVVKDAIGKERLCEQLLAHVQGQAVTESTPAEEEEGEVANAAGEDTQPSFKRGDDVIQFMRSLATYFGGHGGVAFCRDSFLARWLWMRRMDVTSVYAIPSKASDRVPRGRIVKPLAFYRVKDDPTGVVIDDEFYVTVTRILLEDVYDKIFYVNTASIVVTLKSVEPENVEDMENTHIQILVEATVAIPPVAIPDTEYLRNIPKPQ